MRFVTEQSEKELIASIESKIGELVYFNDDVTVRRIELAVEGWWPLRISKLDTVEKLTIQLSLYCTRKVVTVSDNHVHLRL